MSEDKSQEYKKRLSIELTNSLYRADQDPAFQTQRDPDYRSDQDPLYWNDVSVITGLARKDVGLATNGF